MPILRIFYMPCAIYPLQLHIAMAATCNLASAAARSSCLKSYLSCVRRRHCSGDFLITGRILYARIFGSGVCHRNPPYTTFYHVRRRSCSEKIFSLQAAIWAPANFGRRAYPPSQAAVHYFLLCSATPLLYENVVITGGKFLTNKLWSARSPS